MRRHFYAVDDEWMRTAETFALVHRFPSIRRRDEWVHSKPHNRTAIRSTHRRVRTSMRAERRHGVPRDFLFIDHETGERP